MITMIPKKRKGEIDITQQMPTMLIAEETRNDNNRNR